MGISNMVDSSFNEVTTVQYTGNTMTTNNRINGILTVRILSSLFFSRFFCP